MTAPYGRGSETEWRRRSFFVVCDPLSCRPQKTILRRGDWLTPAAYLAHCVYAPALAFEVRAHQHFSQKSGAEHHHAAEQQKAARDHQRTVFGKHSMSPQLVYRQPPEDGRADYESAQ